MSNAVALATITAALQRILSRGITADLPPELPTSLNLNNTRVTVAQLDRARTRQDTNQINLCLYRVTPNGALRNETLRDNGRPALALDLHYLVTVYAQGDDDTAAQILLGQAMKLFDDHAILSGQDLRDAIPGSDVHRQIEHVRLTLETLSLEDISKLWTIVQSPYRLSVAYEARVALIESALPDTSPLPVLRRNITVVPDAHALPVLTALDPPGGRNFALVGDVVTLRGAHLSAATVVVRLSHPALTAPVDLAPQPGGSSAAVQVAVPSTVLAGVHAVSIILREGGRERTTNTLPLAVAPVITTPLPLKVTRNAQGAASIELSFAPAVSPQQRVSLLIGDREIVIKSPVTGVSKLTFVVPAATPGDFFLRLRVDGVESSILDPKAKQPAFDQTRKVSIA